MVKNQRLLKLFVVLFFSSAFMFSTTHFGVQAFEKFTDDGSYSEGTTVGSLDVTGKSESEVISLLEEKYLDWVKNTKIELQYSEKIVPFDINLFQLDSTQTVNNIMDGQPNAATITIELLQVEEQIQILFPQVDSNELELSKLTNDLIQTASQFETGSYSFNLTGDYQLADAAQKDAVINEAVLKLKEIPFDLESVIEANPEITIAEEATFSLLEFAKQQSKEKSDSLNVIATGIYQAILPTNFAITERNISSVLPGYAVLGFEARVNFAQGADLVIVNPNKTKYILEFKLENNNFKVTLKGEKFLYDYKIIKKDEQQLKPKTILQYSPLVLLGKIKVKTVGADGRIIKVYRDIFQGSKLVNSELISEDYYQPTYRVEIHGLTGTTDGNQPISGIEPTDVVDPTGNQTPLPSDILQQGLEDDELWGNPNEQAK
ncbi:hypothetical protein [Neobacillus sp. FSL H8-0543]|uniref:hypothetical protein n=1 Tax=Neobacillus sp. FSL H8-0543 TaxID=2954672 RepID=UPI0031590A27